MRLTPEEIYSLAGVLVTTSVILRNDTIRMRSSMSKITQTGLFREVETRHGSSTLMIALSAR